MAFRGRSVVMLLCAPLWLTPPALAVDLVINPGGTATLDSGPYVNVNVYDQGCTTNGCTSTPTLLEIIVPADASLVFLHGSTQARYQGGAVGSIRLLEDTTLEIEADGLASAVVRGRGLAIMTSGLVSNVSLEGDLVDTTRLRVDGGRITNVTARWLADVTMNAGHVSTMDLGARLAGTFTLNGGFVGAFFTNNGDKDFFINGGTIDDGISASTDNRVFLNAGRVTGAIWARFGARVEIRGGQDIPELRTQGDEDDPNSLIEVWGWNFLVDGVPVPYGDLGAQSGTLTGTLVNGDALAATFLTNGTGPGIDWIGAIRLINPPAVPALSPGARFALCALLAGAALAWRRSLGRP